MSTEVGAASLLLGAPQRRLGRGFLRPEVREGVADWQPALWDLRLRKREALKRSKASKAYRLRSLGPKTLALCAMSEEGCGGLRDVSIVSILAPRIFTYLSGFCIGKHRLGRRLMAIS